jgi:hypothetical protein
VRNPGLVDHEDGFVDGAVHVAGVFLVGAELDVAWSVELCFFEGVGRGCHCVWSWTQARPASSGRTPSPFSGRRGPLSAVSVVCSLGSRTKKLFFREN